jgi:hypothetical protein
VRTPRWRYVYWLDAPEQLFDLERDPEEFHDLGRDESTAETRRDMRGRLLDWFTRRKRRTSVSHDFVEAGTDRHKQAGVFFGQW